MVSLCCTNSTVPSTSPSTYRSSWLTISPMILTALPMLAEPRALSGSEPRTGVLDIVFGVASFFKGTGAGSGGTGFGVMEAAGLKGSSSSLRLFHILILRPPHVHLLIFLVYK